MQERLADPDEVMRVLVVDRAARADAGVHEEIGRDRQPARQARRRIRSGVLGRAARKPCCNSISLASPPKPRHGSPRRTAGSRRRRCRASSPWRTYRREPRAGCPRGCRAGRSAHRRRGRTDHPIDDFTRLRAAVDIVAEKDLDRALRAWPVRVAPDLRTAVPAAGRSGRGYRRWHRFAARQGAGEGWPGRAGWAIVRDQSAHGIGMSDVNFGT